MRKKRGSQYHTCVNHKSHKCDITTYTHYSKLLNLFTFLLTLCKRALNSKESIAKESRALTNGRTSAGFMS